jgi:hypothetical protein
MLIPDQQTSIKKVCTAAVWALLDNEPRFHNHVAQLVAQALKMLGPIHYITSSISTTESLSLCIVPLRCLNLISPCSLKLYHTYWFVYKRKNSKKNYSIMP